MEESMEVTSPVVDSEESLPMKKVNDLIKRTKVEEASRVQRALEAKHAQEIESLKASMGQSSQAPVDMDSMYGEFHKRLMNDVSQHQQKQAEAQETERLKKLAHAYVANTVKGAEKFEDWKEVTQNFNPQKFPELSLLLGQFENGDELLYDLNKRPQTLAAVQLMADRSPEMAEQMLKEISGSIAENNKAKEQHVPTPQPLSRTKSSTAGADSGAWTYEDLKNADWLKG